MYMLNGFFFNRKMNFAALIFFIEIAALFFSIILLLCNTIIAFFPSELCTIIDNFDYYKNTGIFWLLKFHISLFYNLFLLSSIDVCINTYIFLVFLFFINIIYINISYYFLGYTYSFRMVTIIGYFLLINATVVMFVAFRYDFLSYFSLNLLLFFIGDSFSLFSFQIDNISLVFSTTTIIIGFFTGSFQYFYLSDDLKKDRFFFFFYYFILSMVILVHSGNFILLLLGWELLGVTSFFLIVHYDIRYLTIKAGLKAFFFNRLSDVFLIASTVILYRNTGSFYINNSQFFIESNYGFLALLFIILASFIKSAQFCFFFWLPDSMEAPIPASALIHSATLVSAGVYIILRLINYIVVWPFLINLILLATTVTLLFFCPIILMQTDLKKLLALSTIVNISFLYLMVVSLNNSIVCFYFVVHGLFKSCSFLFVGCFILINAHSQDHRFFKPLSNNNYMIGFLLFICVFFLSGSNILLVYKIKHEFDFKNTCHLYINELISLSFWVYSIFSLLYGLKIYYYIFIRQTQNRLSSRYVKVCGNDYLVFETINQLLVSYLVYSILTTIYIYYCIYQNYFIFEYFNGATIQFKYKFIFLKSIIYFVLATFFLVFSTKKYFYINRFIAIIIFIIIFI